jgi:hypothetical protein
LIYLGRDLSRPSLAPMIEKVDPKGGHPARRQRGGVSLIGASLPERIRALAFSLLGLTTAAGLALVLLFSQTTLPIPSLGPLTEPLPGHQGSERGTSVGAIVSSGGISAPGAASRASSTAASSSAGLPAGSTAADFTAAAAPPQSDGGAGPGAGDSPSISGNERDVPAVQPQPTAVGPTDGSGSTPSQNPAEEPGPSAAPGSDSVPASPPSIPTAEVPPVVEPEAPQPPPEELPEAETPTEEPPVLEPPADDDGEGSLEPTGPGPGPGSD